jgi:uncharacterized protein YrrD
MQFQQDVSIVTANGQEVGHIDRVVVDPQAKAVTHIVVRKGFLFKKEKIVPIGLIANATEDRITLRADAGDLEALPPFEEKHYVQPEGGTAPTNSPPGSAPSLYVPSPLGGAQGASLPDERHIAQIEQNIPEGTIAMKEGAKAITTEGKHVGNVEGVFTDLPEERATHLLISKGLLSKERKLIPITWVTIMGEDEVHLAVKEEALEDLGVYRS